MTIEALAKEIKSAVEWLISSDVGCSTIKLDNKLAVCVGWSNGYDENDDTVIHSKSSPSFAINAAIKVWTSDAMRTDLDWINMPYYSDGEVIDTSVSIEPNEDYTTLAKFFLKEYEVLSKMAINDNGLVEGGE